MERQDKDGDKDGRGKDGSQLDRQMEISVKFSESDRLNLLQTSTNSKHCSLYITFFFFCLTTQWAGSQFPYQGLNQRHLQQERRDLTTGPPGKPLQSDMQEGGMGKKNKTKTHLFRYKSEDITLVSTKVLQKVYERIIQGMCVC